VLSAEKCPKLCGTLPAYEGLLLKLKEYQQKHQAVSNVLEKGIEKLVEYQQETDNVPAYTLSICKCLVL
jgi:allophanate hydrolase subunit 1